MVLALVVVLAAVCVSSAAALMVVTSDPQALGGCRLADTPPRLLGGDTLLTAADGSALGYVPTSQNREPVGLDRMSRWLPAATVAIEDRRFWHHGALDLRGVLRSLVADVSSGRAVQGGSTITEQLVRNRYLGGASMNLSRKLTEVCLASELFARRSRTQILEAYLNTVYYGHHARGVQAAAWTYFSRPASRLSLSQAAMLAGLPQAPTDDDPLSHPLAARARRDQVLAAMLRAQDISRASYRAARDAPLGLRAGRHYTGLRSATFFDAARDELAARLGRSRVRHGGLRVQTTMASRLQRLAVRAIGRWIGSAPDPAAALVAIDPATGDVLAAATKAPGAGPLSFNLVTQSRRQAGSAFKMFTLVTALEQGIPLSSVWHGPSSLLIPDRRCMNADGPWIVHNFADESSGTMDLVHGIAHSVNTIFAQVALRVGPRNIVRTARLMGVRSPLTPVCSITLGPEGVSPLEMTDAFATLAAGGVRHAPQFLRAVSSAGGARIAIGAGGGRRVLSRTVAEQATYALSAVLHGGTGTAADPGRPAAGKTGTAESEADAWFCGYVPQLAACVWIGYPGAETAMTSLDGFAPVVGGSVPARIWHDFMVPALANRRIMTMPQADVAQVRTSTGALQIPPSAAPSSTTTPASSIAPALPPASLTPTPPPSTTTPR